MSAYLTSKLFAIVLALVPFGVSAAYMCAVSRDCSLVKRLATSAHGAALSVLWLAAILVDMLGKHHRLNWDFFGPACLLPLVLIAYSLWQYDGRRWVHAMQFINIVWLLGFLVFGGMLVNGVWV